MNHEKLRHEIVQLASAIRYGSTNPMSQEPHEVLRYAVLKYLEDERGVDVMVKYGDDEAVREQADPDWGSAWGVVGGENWTRFQVEPRSQSDSVPREARDLVHDTFSAIGAWSLGRARCKLEGTTDHHYLWPTDHPVTDLVEEEPSGEWLLSNIEDPREE